MGRLQENIGAPLLPLPLPLPLSLSSSFVVGNGNGNERNILLIGQAAIAGHDRGMNHTLKYLISALL
jgi:hypothetical protein